MTNYFQLKGILKQAVDLGELRSFDLHLALFLQRFCPPAKPEQLLAATLVSQAAGNGHICLPLDQVAGKAVFASQPRFKAPDLDAWRKILRRWSAVGNPGETTPLVLDHADRIYLKKYHRFQETISNDLLKRAQKNRQVATIRAAALINKLFPDDAPLNWQKAATALTLLRQLVIITGGPGTGKTYTVARVLALLQTLASQKLTIGIAAPTGKAANRLKESIATAKRPLEPDLRDRVPTETKTIHRLLGVEPGSYRFRHNKNNRLNIDLLVLDETSMIDIPLMAALLEALPDHTQLIMLGDKDQLSSVEAGSLLGDLCPAPQLNQWSPSLCGQLEELTGFSLRAAQVPPFADSLIELKTSYRFTETGNIGRVAEAVNQGDEKKLGRMLTKRQPDFSFIDHSALERAELVNELILPELLRCRQQNDKKAMLLYFDNFRVLCALRNGPYGVEGINSIVETSLQKRGLITNQNGWYKGQPVMVRDNHYGLQLFNGDSGIIWPDDNGIYMAWFQRANGTLRPIAPARLPGHETAYAITIHKSQGSEFAEVIVIMPAEKSRLLSRELLYTGITRARKKLTLYSPRSILTTTLKKRVSRYSGIRDKLYGHR